MKKFPVIVALDGMDREQALAVAEELSGRVWGFKIHILVDTCGSEIIQLLKPFGKIFVDFKLHDTPDTIHQRTKAFTMHNADIITVHASAGKTALKSAVEVGGIRVAAVTTLTSEEQSETAIALAQTAYEAGVRTIVCSAHEAEVVRAIAPDSTIITPGIRGAEDDTHDQKRIATPQEALKAGADLLVIGRPIAQSEKPLEELERLMRN